MRTLRHPTRATVARAVIGAVLGVLLLWLALRSADTEALVQRLGDFPWTLLLPVTGLVLLSALVRAWRWRLLFRDRERRPGLARLFFVENTGIGMNNLSPVRAVAEPVQFAYLSVQDGHERGEVLATLVQVRVIDLFVTLASIVIGLAVYRPERAAPQGVWASIAILGAIALAITAASLTLRPTLPWLRWAAMDTYSEAWRGLLRAPRRLAAVLAVTLGQWWLLGVVAWAIARALGIALPLPLVYVLMLAIFTTGLTLPGLPSAIGPLEFAATVYLPLYGVPVEAALAFSVVMRAAFLLPPTAIAVLTVTVWGPPWPRRRREAGMAGRRSLDEQVAGGGDEGV